MRLLLFLSLLLVSITSFSQTESPLIRNYANKEYNASGSNFGITQDSSGMLYFGNFDGLLTFDGHNWGFINVANGKGVTSVHASDNQIYVGSNNEFGYIDIDFTGRREYVSLSSEFDDLVFGGIHQVISNLNNIFFVSISHLFSYSKETGEIVVLPAKKGGNFTLNSGIFSLKKKDYIYMSNSLLMEITRNSLEEVPNTKALQFENYPVFIPRDKDILIVCKSGRGYFFDGDSLYQTAYPELTLKEELNVNFTVAKQIINDSTLIYGTSNDGIYFQNNSKQYLNVTPKNGLPSNLVRDIYIDHESNIWITTFRGVSTINDFSKWSRYYKKDELTSIKDIIKYNGNLYTLSLEGTGYIITSNGITDFDPEGQVGTYLHLHKETLFAFSIRDGGISQFEDDKIASFHKFVGAIFAQRLDETRAIVAALTNGMFMITFNDVDPSSIKSIEKLVDYHFTSGLVSNGLLYQDVVWFNIKNSGLYQCNLNANYTVKKYTEKQGLPGGNEVFNIVINNKLLFATGKGFYKLNTEPKSDSSDLFIPDNSLITERFGIGSPVIDSKGNIWFLADYYSNEARVEKLEVQPDGSYQRITRPFERLPIQDLEIIYPDPEEEGIIWISGSEGLYRYDDNIKTNLDIPYHTLMRQVTTSDSVIFYGSYTDFSDTTSRVPALVIHQPESFKPTLSYVNNNITFNYSAASYIDPERNQFSYFLEGNDLQWSAWSLETKKEYTNLSPGEYTFSVKSKNLYDVIGYTASYTFTILPPWYLTWWAYILYALSGIGFIYALFTYELRRQNTKNQLKLKRVESEKLKEVDQMKSRLFTNISHEFRTPLTLIFGPVERLLSNTADKKDRQRLTTIQKSATTLLGLVNQMLDLSKIEAGKLALQLETRDIVSQMRAIFEPFTELAKRRNNELILLIDQQTLMTSYDQGKFEMILNNLLSNAVKFTNSGQITLEASYDKKSARLTFCVIDTGIGISEKDLENVFDRFYQVDSSEVRQYEGTGIGLTLTRELVELMGGSISAKSKVGQGSEFKITLPLVEDLEVPEPTMTEASREPFVLHEEIEVTPTAGNEAPLVLIVEDNEDIRLHIADLLSDRYNILQAENGKEGLKLANEEFPELVISDIMMHGMSGVELCEQLKTNQATSHIPVVLLTAKVNMDSKIQGLETGADDYMTKPFNHLELLTRVKNLIEQRRKLREKFTLEPSSKPAEVAVNAVDKQFLDQALKIIENHLNNDDFDVTLFTQEIGLSRTQLHHKLKALTGQSATEFNRTVRLKKAADMLRQKHGNISEISSEVGFKNPTYFAKSFKKLFGESPSEYQSTNG